MTQRQMRPNRILHVFASLDRGGAETAVMNWYRQIDLTLFQFDFVVNDRDAEYAYEDEIRSLGGRIYRVPPPTLPSIASHIRVWRQLLANHPEWKIVHAHYTAPALGYLSLARRSGLVTIAHSHIAGSERNAKGLLRGMSQYPLRFVANRTAACSIAAGKAMFGTGRSKTTTVIPNAIDSSAFAFDDTLRRETRSTLNIREDAFVVGHVGRMDPQKNHLYLIDIFSEILRLRSDAELIMVGDGALRSRVEQRVESLGVAERVHFLGVRTDMPQLYAAMDVFVLPSLYEGLPVAAIEAQASGLPTLASDSITEEVALKPLVRFMSLKDSPQVWASTTLEIATTTERNRAGFATSLGPYDLRESPLPVESLYAEILESM